eukprot:jgi/Tetstr1/447604/TSEL_034965.t1
MAAVIRPEIAALTVSVRKISAATGRGENVVNKWTIRSSAWLHENDSAALLKEVLEEHKLAALAGLLSTCETAKAPRDPKNAKRPFPYPVFDKFFNFRSTRGNGGSHNESTAKPDYEKANTNFNTASWLVTELMKKMVSWHGFQAKLLTFLGSFRHYYIRLHKQREWTAAHHALQLVAATASEAAPTHANLDVSAR